MADVTQLIADTEAPLVAGLDQPLMAAGSGMSPAIRIMLDEKLFDRMQTLAKFMSQAIGIIPKHLEGKAASCFAVLTRAITWKLDPYAVAQSTYETPGGRVGYEGKLCQAILENSGKLVGPVRFEHYGSVTVQPREGQPLEVRSNARDLEQLLDDGAKIVARKGWEAVQGKFDIAKSKHDKDYARRLWTPADAKGLGVTVSAQVRGEVERREWSFDLVQAFPLNSTLWATDPKTQICYTAVRRFGNVAAPGLFMGVPFEPGDFEEMKDVTPAAAPERPRRETFTRGGLPANSSGFTDVETSSNQQKDAPDAPAGVEEDGGAGGEGEAGSPAEPEDSAGDALGALPKRWQDYVVERESKIAAVNTIADLAEMQQAQKAHYEHIGASGGGSEVPEAARQLISTAFITRSQQLQGARGRR